MANTYSQIYIQIVFAVKGRQNLISSKWKDELFKYITGMLQMKVKIDCNQWNARPRSYSNWPNKALSDLVRDIKPIHQDSLMKKHG
jgi:hypothetical protein